MANKKKHIDDLFKDNLQGSQLPLDGSEWDRLAGALHPKKKKRFAWWWIGVGILFLTAVGYFVATMDSNPVETEIANGNSEQNIEKRKESKEGNSDSTGETIDASSNNIDGTVNSIESDKDHNQKSLQDKFNDSGTNVKSADSQPKDNTNTSNKNGEIGNPETKVNNGSSKAENQKFQLVKLAPKSNVILYNKFNPYGAPLLSLEERLDQKPPFYIYPMESLIDTFDPIKKFIDPYVGFTLVEAR